MIGASAILAAGSGGQILPPPLGEGGAGGTGATATSGDMTTATATGTGGGGTGTGGSAPAPELTWVAKLDVTKFQLPEGLAMNTAYVSLAPTGQILQIAVADGKVSDFGTVPQPPPGNKGFVLGMQTLQSRRQGRGHEVADGSADHRRHDGEVPERPTLPARRQRDRDLRDGLLRHQHRQGIDREARDQGRPSSRSGAEARFRFRWGPCRSTRTGPMR